MPGLVYCIEVCTFEDKQLALEALNIKVYIDGDNIDIQGAIPVDDILSTPAWSGGNRFEKINWISGPGYSWQEPPERL